MKVEKVIVTRHAGLVEWLRLQGITGQVIAHATEENVRGRVVYGVLPLHLASLAELVVVVDMPRLAPADRGRDLSPAEMDAAGAVMRQYRVISESTEVTVTVPVGILSAVIKGAWAGDCGAYAREAQQLERIVDSQSPGWRDIVPQATV